MVCCVPGDRLIDPPNHVKGGSNTTRQQHWHIRVNVVKYVAVRAVKA